MVETLIADIIEPTIFLKYMMEQSVKNSSLIRSGIIVPDPKLDILAATGGLTVNMPFFKDLTGNSEGLSDQRELSLNAIGSDKDIARMHMRGKAWGSNDLAAAIAGADPMKAIAQRVSEFWNMDDQDLLLACLDGLFKANIANNASDLVHNAASEAMAGRKEWNDAAPTVMNPIAIIDGTQLLGDAKKHFTAIMMHSKCVTDLVKQELIEYVQPAGETTLIPTYLGKEIIENDNCPTREGSTDGTIYQSFLFGKGAIGKGEGSAPVPVETGRKELGGVDFLITRRHFLLHPRGIKWQESNIAESTPSFEECGQAAQWDRVYEQKNIRMAMIETN